MLHPVGQRDDGEDDQGGDLDDVDRHVDRGRAGDSPEGDVGDAEREDDAEEDHEQRAVVRGAERVRPELVQEVAAENRGHSHHAARVNPVVQMARPTREELGHPRKFVRVGLRQERLLGVEVGRTGAGIELGQLGVAHGRGQAQQQGAHDAEPHGAAGHRGSIQGLFLVGEPQECAGCDQGHCINGQTGEAQGGLHRGGCGRGWFRHRIIGLVFSEYAYHVIDKRVRDPALLARSGADQDSGAPIRISTLNANQFCFNAS